MLAGPPSRTTVTRWVLAALLIVLIVNQSALSAQSAVSTQGPPPRDTSARSGDRGPTATGRITGRVLTADTGKPVKRARVLINAPELPGGRGTLTDDLGVFDFTELPQGRYTVAVSKSGFVSLSYGQRRPLQAGTPLQLGEGQQLRGVDFLLPRGSVIGGRILDEDSEPMPGVTIRVMRYEYQQGERRLTPVGSSQTDDRGSYRVWGLMPGEYYVDAVARAGFGRNIAQDSTSGRANGGDHDVNYAPTYYPGSPSLDDAKSVTVGLSQEVLDINFSLQLVPMARIMGHVSNADGTPSTAGSVNLTSDVPRARANRIGANFGGRIGWDGAFTIANVPPGRYLLRTRGGNGETPQYATLPVSVTGGDIGDLSVVLQAGAALTGTVMFTPGVAEPPDPSQFRMTAPAVDPGEGSLGPQPSARLDKDGKFSLVGVPAGPHLIRSAGNSRGWTLKSVTIGGRDVTDSPIELRAGETISNIVVSFTDKVTEIGGTVVTEQGQPAAELTVLAFPTDTSLWRPASRQIMTARPDQTGKYRIRGLPPGEYYLTTVDPVEQGEWFESAYLSEHRDGATRLTLGDGDLKTQDLKIKH